MQEMIYLAKMKRKKIEHHIDTPRDNWEFQLSEGYVNLLFFPPKCGLSWKRAYAKIKSPPTQQICSPHASSYI